MQDNRNCNEMGIMTMESVMHKKNYFITFKPSLFSEFYFYHFLYCCLLGHLSIPIVSLINNRNFILIKNLQFWGLNRSNIS